MPFSSRLLCPRAAQSWLEFSGASGSNAGASGSGAGGAGGSETYLLQWMYGNVAHAPTGEPARTPARRPWARAHADLAPRPKLPPQQPGAPSPRASTHSVHAECEFRRAPPSLCRGLHGAAAAVMWAVHPGAGGTAGLLGGGQLLEGAGSGHAEKEGPGGAQVCAAWGMPGLVAPGNVRMPSCWPPGVYLPWESRGNIWMPSCWPPGVYLPWESRGLSTLGVPGSIYPGSPGALAYQHERTNMAPGGESPGSTGLPACRCFASMPGCLAPHLHHEYHKEHPPTHPPPVVQGGGARGDGGGPAAGGGWAGGAARPGGRVLRPGRPRGACARRR
jgi:hypothetical protein